MNTDFRLTVDQVAKINEAHGGGGVLCHGSHTVELLNPLGKPEGWNTIARDPETGLCSKRDLAEALGY